MQTWLLIVSVGLTLCSSTSAPDTTGADLDTSSQSKDPELPPSFTNSHTQATEQTLRVQDAGVGDLPAVVSVATEPSTPRHVQEKQQLLLRLEKSSGTYNMHHARSRLLKALWSFRKYRDSSKAEVNRWRDMYKKITKQQKAVGLTG
jgi:hypothetical protein